MRLLTAHLPAPLEQAVKACRPHFAGAALFSAFVNLLYLAPTIYMIQVYDRVVPTGGTLTLFWLTVVLCVAIGTLASLDAVRSRLMMRAGLRLNNLLSGLILDRLIARSGNKPGNAQVMRDFDHVRQTLAGPGAIALFDLPWTPLYIIVAGILHPALALFILVGGAILVVLAVFNESSARRAMKQGLQANASAFAAQDAAVGKAETIRALGMRRAMVARQLLEREEGLACATHQQFHSIRYTGLVKFTRMFLQSLALGIGAWLAVNGQISVGAIIAASLLLSRALQPIEQMVAAWPGIGQARVALESIGTLFEETEGLVQQRMLLPEPEGYVELSNVIVRNPEGTALLLRSVSLWVMPGEVLGVIGASGAGKSTLARVVAGALPPQGGSVRIDEASYSDWDPEELARHIGYLPQEPTLLNGSIGENISRFAAARGVNQAEIDHKVVRAAMLAGVHDLILHIPDGYNAMIGDAGIRLSGGQTQRIALARALYDDPKVLVFDEPCAALDASGEKALLRAVAEAKKRGAAVMLIEHRRSILAVTDRLAVVAKGMIERHGPRDEVIAALNTAADETNVVKMGG